MTTDKTVIVVTGSRKGVLTVLKKRWLLDFVCEVLSHTSQVEFRHGDARGIDRSAADAVRDLSRVTIKPYPANWDRYGRAAGPRRNAEMLDGADVLLAFPGGLGTADCVRQALAKGVQVVHFPAKYRKETKS